LNVFLYKIRQIWPTIIKFALRCLYIEDDNRFMFLTEIKNVGKPDVEIEIENIRNGIGQ
jgi:hypothetical protein